MTLIYLQHVWVCDGGQHKVTFSLQCVILLPAPAGKRGKMNVERKENVETDKREWRWVLLDYYES